MNEWISVNVRNSGTSSHQMQGSRLVLLEVEVAVVAAVAFVAAVSVTVTTSLVASLMTDEIGRLQTPILEYLEKIAVMCEGEGVMINE
jgi:hypothetical protein